MTAMQLNFELKISPLLNSTRKMLYRIKGRENKKFNDSRHRGMGTAKQMAKNYVQNEHLLS